MSEVSTTQEIPVAAGSVRAALARTLHQLQLDSLEGRVSLGAPVGRNPSEKLADVGVAVRVDYEEKNSGLHLEAIRNRALFPSFTGTIEVQPMAPARSVVRLKGRYDVPGGVLGASLDRAALGSYARDSLVIFLAKVVEGVLDSIAHDARAEQQRRFT